MIAELNQLQMEMVEGVRRLIKQPKPPRATPLPRPEATRAAPDRDGSHYASLLAAVEEDSNGCVDNEDDDDDKEEIRRRQEGRIQ